MIHTIEIWAFQLRPGDKLDADRIVIEPGVVDHGVPLLDVAVRAAKPYPHCRVEQIPVEELLTVERPSITMFGPED